MSDYERVRQDMKAAIRYEMQPVKVVPGPNLSVEGQPSQHFARVHLRNGEVLIVPVINDTTTTPYLDTLPKGFDISQPGDELMVERMADEAARGERNGPQ